MYTYTFTHGGLRGPTKRLRRLMVTLADAIGRSPHKFMQQYARNCVDISRTLIQHPGLKTELHLKPDENAFDIIRFAAVFSDVVSIRLVPTAKGKTGFGTTGEGIRVYFQEALAEDVLRTLRSPAIQLIAPLKEDFNPFVRKISPLISTSRVIIAPIFEISDRSTDAEPKKAGASVKSKPRPERPLTLIGDGGSFPLLPQTLRLFRECQYFDVVLPYLRGIPFKTLAKILTDEENNIAQLRCALRSAISEGVSESLSPEEIRNNLIRPKVETLNRRFKSLLSMHSIRVTGASLGTFALVLSSISSGEISTIIPTLLGAGGIGVLTKAYSDYVSDLSALREDDWYLLWRLQKARKGEANT